MKLVIDIDDEVYNRVKQTVVTNDVHYPLCEAVRNGTPLEKHDAEIIKKTVESVWGKPPYTEVLDKITAEIEEIIQEETIVNMNGGEYEHTESKLDSDNVLQIIDKYRKGQTDADSD